MEDLSSLNSPELIESKEFFMGVLEDWKSTFNLEVSPAAMSAMAEFIVMVITITSVRLVKRIGDDPELLQELLEDFEDVAAKFNGTTITF